VCFAKAGSGKAMDSPDHIRPSDLGESFTNFGSVLLAIQRAV